MSRRTERIAAQLLAELSRLLRQDLTDPRLALVTLTRADVAPDLSHALIYWSALDVGEDADAGDVDAHQAGLESAAAFLRRRAAAALPLRRMPALRFRYDPSFVLGGRTLSVLRDLALTDPAPGHELAPTDAAPGEPAAGGDGGGDDGAQE